MRPENPYIAGNPVGDSPAFVGRLDVLREVVRVLRRSQDNALVLYGQRRIGKTSILEHLAVRLPEMGPYRPVYFDLQDKATRSLDQVLEELAATIAEALGKSAPNLGENPQESFRLDWLPKTLEALPEESSLILLFDEFDVLADPAGEQAGKAFFPYLRRLLEVERQKLQFLFVIGRNVDDLDNIALSVFKATDAYRVSLLKREHCAELVRLSEANGSLRWEEEAVERVWELSHGHPLLTQQLCSHVWENLHEEEPEDPPVVGPEAVDAAVEATLDASQNSLIWLWEGLPPAERIIISALAELGPRGISTEELERCLHEAGVRVVIRDLQNAPRQLQEWDVLEPDEEGKMRFRVELLRRWVVRSKPLQTVQKEIDHIEPVAQNLFQAAEGLYKNQQLEPAVGLLRQAVGLNPNHQSANVLLADLLLSQGELEEARELLERLYEYQPAAARHRLVQVLLQLAQVAGKEKERLGFFEQVLKIEPNQVEALAGKRDITRRLSLASLKRAEDKGDFSKALRAAAWLEKSFPEEDWGAQRVRLEKKEKLEGWYQRAMGAVQEKDWPTVREMLAKVIAIDPQYRQASRLLYRANHHEDPEEMKEQLQSARAELSGQREALQIHERRITELKGELARLRRKPKPRQLSRLSPLDYWRLFHWFAFRPDLLKRYRSVHGTRDQNRLGNWLVSFLLWSPFAILGVAANLGYLRLTEGASGPIVFLGISLLLMFFWSGLAGLRSAVANFVLFIATILGLWGFAKMLSCISPASLLPLLVGTILVGVVASALSGFEDDEKSAMADYGIGTVATLFAFTLGLAVFQDLCDGAPEDTWQTFRLLALVCGHGGLTAVALFPLVVADKGVSEPGRFPTPAAGWVVVVALGLGYALLLGGAFLGWQFQPLEYLADFFVG